jgi:DnaB-like helicase N terminal domain/AAA domain
MVAEFTPSPSFRSSLEISQLLSQLSNEEAEEAILGGILLDPFAIERVSPVLSLDAFATENHQIIYRAAVNLHSQGRPTDLMSMTAWLADHKTLEKVGGINKLAKLVDRTTSTVNIDQYAALVMDKYTRRKLVLSGYKIQELGLKNYLELPVLLEEAEFQVHAVTDLRETSLPYQQAETEIQLKQLTREIEKLEAIKSKNPFKYKLELKGLMKRWDMRSEKEFLDFHAKWLQASQKSRSFSLDEYLEMFGGKSIKWLLDGWIPNSTITVIHSKGGVGKTSLVLTLSKALISGTPWCGYDVNRPLKILWIQTDQGPTVTTRFLDRQGFFKLDSHVRERQRIIDKWGIEEYHVLEEELKEYKYDLVVVDCLATVSSGLIYRENDQEYARPFARLREIGNKYNCSFLVLHHSGWDGKIRGTTAIYNAADQVWALEEVNKSGAVNLTVQKSRFMATPCAYRLEFDSETYSWSMVGEITKSENGEEEFDDLSARPSFQKLYQFLKSNRGTGFEAVELAERTGMNDGTIRKELGFGLSKGLIESFQGHRQRAVYFVGELLASATPDRPEVSNGLSVFGNPKFTVSLPTQEDFVSPRTSDPLDPPCGSSQNPCSVSVDPVDPVDPRFLSLSIASANSENHGSNGSSGSSLTQSEFAVDPRSGSTGSNVTQLNNADVEGFVEMIRYALNEPEAAEGVQESLTSFFATNPGGKKSVWAALTEEERVAFKKLTKPTDALGQVLTVGDRAKDLGDEPPSLGTIKSIDAQKRGSPKEPFTAWKVYVTWDEGAETWEEPAFLEKVTPSEPDPKPRRPKKWEVGDRAQCNGHALTIVGIRGSIHSVKYDGGAEALLGHFDLEILPPDQDPRVRAAKIFSNLLPGNKLKSFKHPDHKGFANRIGTVDKTIQRNDKYLAYCTLTNGEKAIFNLEAAAEVIK